MLWPVIFASRMRIVAAAKEAMPPPRDMLSFQQDRLCGSDWQFRVSRVDSFLLAIFFGIDDSIDRTSAAIQRPSDDGIFSSRIL